MRVVESLKRLQERNLKRSEAKSDELFPSKENKTGINMIQGTEIMKRKLDWSDKLTV
jgi:hypothetical protein